MAAVLCIDHGSRKSGLALADGLRIVTRALDVVHEPGDGPALIEAIAVHADELGADTLLVGLPLGADGEENERSSEVRAFVAKLRARFPGLEVLTHDERLSTKEADALLVEAGITGDARKAQRDAWAALVVLRDWIASGEPR